MLLQPFAAGQHDRKAPEALNCEHRIREAGAGGDHLARKAQCAQRGTRDAVADEHRKDVGRRRTRHEGAASLDRIVRFGRRREGLDGFLRERFEPRREVALRGFEKRQRQH